jgi:hypothetical protein
MPDEFPVLFERYVALVMALEAQPDTLQTPGVLKGLRDHREICARMMHAHPELLSQFFDKWKQTSDRLVAFETSTGLHAPPPYFARKPHLKTRATFTSERM